VTKKARHRIVDLGKILLQRLYRLEQGDQSALAHRLDHRSGEPAKEISAAAPARKAR